jgi:F-type H+-transporting ATPase subunit epsilon
METTKQRDQSLQCVVVTPEKGLLDEPAEFIAVPMFDGELGVLPGRRPMIGRLGIGELRVRSSSGVKRFFIDGGFVQVRGKTVTVLTPKAQAADELNSAAVDKADESAKALRALTPEELTAKEKALKRVRAQRRIIERLSRPGISLS